MSCSYKNRRENIFVRIRKTVMSTLSQIVVCEILLTGLVISLGKLLGNTVLALLCYVVLPITAAIFLCYLRNRNCFKFQKGNMKSKYAKVRFITKLTVVLVFLIIEAFFEELDAANWFSSKVNGELIEMIPYIVCNLMAAIVVSVYPLTYGVVELLFVGEKKLVD